jgi:hypothetical protein
VKKDDDLTGLTYNGATLTLSSSTGINFYFTLASGHSINEYTFTVNGEEVAAAYNKSMKKYYVVYENVAAQKLGVPVEVVVTRNETETEEATTQTISFSVLTYGYSVVYNNAKATLIEVAKALYQYNVAAIAYFGR